jgi:ABC-type sugar transport system permease subunit
MSDINRNLDHRYSNQSHFNIFGSHKISLILLLVFVIFIYIIMFSILHKNNETPSGWVLTIEIILWITLIIIIVVNIKWLSDRDFNIKAEINNLFDLGKLEIDDIKKLEQYNSFGFEADQIVNPLRLIFGSNIKRNSIYTFQGWLGSQIQYFSSKYLTSFNSDWQKIKLSLIKHTGGGVGIP